LNQPILDKKLPRQQQSQNMTCPDACPVSYAMSLIGGKWKCVILYQLVNGPKRFGELRRAVPQITQRMLTLALRELEADGLVNRDVHQVVPPHVEYSLTIVGNDLRPVLSSLSEWGTSHYQAHAKGAKLRKTGK